MKSHFQTVILVVVVGTVLAGCASNFERAEDYAARDDWTRAVAEYRKAYARNPDDIQYKSRLRQAELLAADYYYQRGLRFADQGNYDAAIGEYQQGLSAMPEHSKLLQGINQALAKREAVSLYAEARALSDAGKQADARARLQQALDLDPDNKAVAALFAALRDQDRQKTAETAARTSRAPISLNFRQTDLRAAFEFIGKAFGVNVVFDEGIKPAPVTLFVQNVTFEQGIKLLLATTRTFQKEISPNTILIAPDTKEKRAQYEDQMVRVFYLNNMRAKEMSDIVRTVLSPKKLTTNEEDNALVMRDSPEVLHLAEQLIETNDRRPAEMLLEVEILEVNRTKADRLGLDFGSEIGLQFPTFAVGDSWHAALSAGTVTLPNMALRYFKQDVDARILANPKVRVVNGRPAKIHIGDRVPLRSSTIVDATGQTRTTYEYRDIGIKLNIEPIVHLDNSATVKLGLEVSALGQNLGTATEPAFSIGTRNAETSMVLRDGETVILGGLIQDNDRTNHVKVPGIGEIPVIGSLFTNTDDSRGRTDVLLTITPRVVRGWELPPKVQREFYAGTESNLSDRSAFAAASVASNSTTPPSIQSDGPVAPAPSTPGTGTSPGAGVPAPTGSSGANGEPSPASMTPVISFDQALYNVSAGQEFDVVITARQLSNVASIAFGFVRNTQQLAFVSGQPGDGTVPPSAVTGDAVSNVVRIESDFAGNPPDGSVVARVRLRALQPGVSYLVPYGPTLTHSDGTTDTAQVSAARVTVR